MDKKDIKEVLLKGIVIIGAFTLKKVAENLIEKKLNKNVEKENDSWSSAIQYAALSGAMLGTSKLLIEKTTGQ